MFAPLDMCTFIFTHCGDSQIQREAQHCDGAVFRKLTKHLDEMFARDFPFYLIVAFRVHRCVFKRSTAGLEVVSFKDKQCC